MKNYKNMFQNRLLALMEALGKTPSQLIEDLDLEDSTVSRWVNGKTIARGDKLERLSAYLGVSAEDLLGTANPPPLPKPSKVDPSFLDASKILEVLGRKGPISRAAVLYLLTHEDRYAQRLRDLGAGPSVQALARLHKVL